MSDKWKQLGTAIAKVAPLLGTVIGGPAGTAAGGIVSILAKTFGCDTTPNAIAEAIKIDPQAAVKLREIELTHEQELQKLAIESDRLYVHDVQNARDREVNVVKSTGKADYYLYGLASLVILGFFGLCITLMFVTLPEGSTQVVFMLFGALAAGFGSVLQYFFGSSKSSADKTKMLGSK